MATKLGLYELLTPFFLAGFNLPDYIDKYLAVLGIEELHTAIDDAAIVYTGICTLDGDAAAKPHMEHRAPTGEVFTWRDTQLRFRLTVPRLGISPWLAAQLGQVNAAGTALVGLPGPAAAQQDGRLLQNISALLQTRLQPAGPPGPAPTTDAPHFAFRLELMITEVALHLGKTWRPAIFADHRLVIDPADPTGDVRFILPRVTFQYQQAQDPLATPNFILKSWGQGFDGSTDLLVGELVRMEPPLCIHEGGRIGFGIDGVLLDLSPNSTPPEILAHFGVGDDWTGLYIRSLRVYAAVSAAELAFTLSVRDAVIGFNGDVSLEARLDVVNTEAFSLQVLLFDADRRIAYVAGDPDDDPDKVIPGHGQAPPEATIQVIPIGGVGPFTITVTLGVGQTQVTLPWDDNLGQTSLPKGFASEELLIVKLADSKGKLIYQKIWLSPPAKALPAGPGKPPARPPAVWTPTSAPAGAGVLFNPAPVGLRETLQVFASQHNLVADGAHITITRDGDGATILDTTIHSPFVGVDLPEDTSYHVVVELKEEQATLEYFDLLYHYERPRELEFPGITNDYKLDFVGSEAARIDLAYTMTRPPTPAQPLAPADPDPQLPVPPDPNLAGTRALHAWLQRRIVPTNGKRKVEVHAYSSYESDPAKRLYNQRLSERRLAVAYAVIDDYNLHYPGTPVEITNRLPLQPPPLAVAHGHDEAAKNTQLHTGAPLSDPSPYPPNREPLATFRHGNSWDRAVLIRGSVGGAAPAGSIIGTLARAKSDPQQQPVPPPPRKPPPTPPDARKPGIFRRMGGRVRIERSVPVLFEIDGQLDFETALETSMRKSQSQINGQPAPAGSFLGYDGEDGVVDFSVLVAYDTSTHYLTEAISLHSGAGDKNGLVELKNPQDGGHRWRNALGAMMVLSPILAKGLGDSDLGTAAGWGAMAVTWAVPALIGALNVMESEKITLYGGELRLRQYAPTANNVSFSDAAFLFDYGVDFQINCFDVIKTTKPLRVRYKSVGFALSVPFNNVDQTFSYQPIFDPSKGYEIDLSDPGLFKMDSVVGDLIRVLGARIARFNPLTLEVDLGFILDLGVVKFDEFKVKWPIAQDDPLSGPGTPMILPAGARVDIPGTLKGGGRLHMLSDGFEGSLDLTLVPLKIRIAAGLGVRQLTANNKTATAVIVTLGIEFPSPIVLGATGLGIFGFSGLFAMHYKRLEEPADPANAVGPALGWLQKAKGDPAQLSNDNGALWGPEMDRWSFGVGAVLGSLDGGFLTNLRGMVILELPGPRILICSKMTMLSKLPGTKDGFAATGILGVLDLDFNLKQVTLGVIVDFEVKELLQIKLPIELYFSWDTPEKWHLYLGTIAQPATARILGIVNGGGYFMIAGDKIDNFPISDTEVMSLKGVAVAAGIWAGMVWGWKPVGLYLEVTARADIGVSFSPFFMIGRFNLKGELHLWVISVEAHASLTITVDEKDAFFAGEVCGKVDCVLFSVEGCVDVAFGDKEPKPSGTFPPLIQSVYLQSFAPVLTSGQGGERPIDASLGDAVLADTAPALADLPRVPIDSVPVVQLVCSPLVGAAGEVWDGSPVATTTYTDPLKLATGLGKDPHGYAQLGGRALRYRLKSVSLHRRPAGSNAAFELATWAKVPPAVWRRDPKASNDTANARIDLALGSRTPTPTPRALERSSELLTEIALSFADICTPAAPPASVLFTCCARAVGLSKDGHGWTLDGIAQPDPPGTTRETPPVTKLVVGEPTLSPDEQVLVAIAEEAGDRFFLPARVIGVTAKNLAELAPCRCKRGLQIPRHGPPRGKGQGVDLQKPAGYSAALTAIDQRLWITVNTGAATHVRMLLLADSNWLEDRYEVRQLDAKGNLLKALSLKVMAPQVLGAYAQLPPTWRATPWQNETTTIYDYLLNGEPEFKTMSRLLLSFVPDPACVAIQLRALPGSSNKEFTLSLGAVELRALSEVQRAAHESAEKTSKTVTLKDFLELGEQVPLLQPDSEYMLQLVYAVNGVSDFDPGQGIPKIPVADSAVDVTRKFFFATDAELPARLDSWVLATAPNADETFHFYADPVIVTFNDTAALHMLDAYGAKVQYAIRGADGLPVDPPAFNANGDPSNLDTAEIVHDIGQFTTVEDAQLGSPYHDMAKDYAAENLPCVSVAGGGLSQDVVKLYAKLAPLMAYTFDLTAAPKDPDKPVKIAKADAKQLGDLPFFRRSFKTGRYPGAGAFAEDVRAAKIRHRALENPIDLPGSGPVSDTEMAVALREAGEQALPAPQVNGVTVYWADGKPHALLLDTVEPHWRMREEPALVPVPQADGVIGDPNFRTIQPQQVPSLELEPVTPGSLFHRYVHACGGARTLAFINPAKIPAPGLPPVAATLRLHRPASALYGVDAELHELLTLPVSGRAPWDEVADDE